MKLPRTIIDSLKLTTYSCLSIQFIIHVVTIIRGYSDCEEMSTTGGLSCNTAFAAFLVIFSTSFPFGYNGSVLNQPNVFVIDFYNGTYTERRHDGTSPSKIATTVLWSTTNSAYIVGSLTGYFLGGFLMDIVGRKNIILIGQV